MVTSILLENCEGKDGGTHLFILEQFRPLHSSNHTRHLFPTYFFQSSQLDKDSLCRSAHLLTFLKRLVHPIELRRCVIFSPITEPKEIKKIPTFMVQSSKFIQVNRSKIRLVTIFRSQSFDYF